MYPAEPQPAWARRCRGDHRGPRRRAPAHRDCRCHHRPHGRCAVVCRGADQGSAGDGRDQHPGIAARFPYGPPGPYPRGEGGGSRSPPASAASSTIGFLKPSPPGRALSLRPLLTSSLQPNSSFAAAPRLPPLTISSTLSCGTPLIRRSYGGIDASCMGGSRTHSSAIPRRRPRSWRRTLRAPAVSQLPCGVGWRRQRLPSRARRISKPSGAATVLWPSCKRCRRFRLRSLWSSRSGC